MLLALAAKALELLATPTGAISLVAALLAGGFAIREYRGRRNGNGYPRLPTAAAGEHTGQLFKDLKALGGGAVEAEVLATDVNRLEGRLDGLASEMRAGQAQLQQQIIDLSLENQQQGQKLEGEIALLRQNGPAETSVLVIATLREEGLFDRRKKQIPIAPPRDRRKPDPEAGGR